MKQSRLWLVREAGIRRSGSRRGDPRRRGTFLKAAAFAAAAPFPLTPPSTCRPAWLSAKPRRSSPAPPWRAALRWWRRRAWGRTQRRPRTRSGRTRTAVRLSAGDGAVRGGPRRERDARTDAVIAEARQRAAREPGEERGAPASTTPRPHRRAHLRRGPTARPRSRRARPRSRTTSPASATSAA